LRGSEVLGPNNELFATMRSLVTALSNNDGDATRATLDALELARQTVSTARTSVGARLARLSDVADTSLSLETQLGIEQSELTAVDVAKVAPALSGAQTMLQAVIATSRQILDQVGTGWLR
jgi:flagellin-like hook-associated protein FlgL